MKKQPEVTARTRKELMESFWQLYCEKGMEKVTVGSVTKMAKLNRGTFYEYFNDLYDLLNQMEDDLLKELQAQIKQAFSNGIPRNFLDFSHICAHIFSSHDDKIYILLSERGDPAFASKLKGKLYPTLLEMFPFSEQDIKLEYLTTFAFSAMVGMLNLWYAEGKKIGIEELFQTMQSLVANGLLGYTKKNIFE